MIYEFTIDLTATPAALLAAPAQVPLMPVQPGSSAFDATSGVNRPNLFGGPVIDEVSDFIIPGLRSLDEAMKLYWSGLRIPTKESYRFLRIKIAGQDKSVAIWRDDLLNGRARLPVAAISRTKWEFNKEKFSPAYHPMTIRYPGGRGNVAAFVYRPIPLNVSYSLSVWAERKRHMEYANFQIVSRFNPIAEFRMSDGRLQGTILLYCDGASDETEKEVTFEQHALIKYEYILKAEAWLPLPERLVPTVLGTAVTLRNQLGDILAQKRLG